jgi:DNA (cytosine-5)-methyltransferase 1
MGYHRAGFDVIGVDIVRQPRYPFPFLRADAVDLLAHGFWRGFDAVHASPPCQEFTALKVTTGRDYEDLLTPTRTLLREIDRPWIIENVPGAPGAWTVLLCASMFDAPTSRDRRLYRHRYFECYPSGCFAGLLPPCVHDREAVTVTGTGGGNGGPNAEKFEAMGIDWMKREELSQAIPPAYTEWLGKQLLSAVEALVA